MPQRLIQLVFFGDPNGYPPIINCARSLAAEGWRVEIICRSARTHPDVAYPADVNVIRLGGWPRHAWLDYVSFVWKALRAVRKDAAFVVGHDMHGLVPAALGAWRGSLPLAYHCHDFSENDRRLPRGSALVKRLERRIAPRARFVIVPDEARAAVVQRELGLANPVVVLPNAPRRKAIPATGRLRAALRDRGLAFDKVVLRQGRIGPNHGIEGTLRSIPSWAGRWGFVLIGPVEEEYHEGLRRLAAELHVEDRVAILPVASYDEILGYTIEADMGHAMYEPANINHVEMGTASNKILEYMAAGVPCLVSRSSSAARLVSSLGCGVAADPADPVDVARAVNAILAQPEACRRMADAGRTAFEKQLCYDIGFGRLASALESAMRA